MSKIVVVGSCNIDITVECDRWVHPGETIFGNRLTVSPGGRVPTRLLLQPAWEQML